MALTERELEKQYDDFLNECYPEITIAGIKGYSTARVLKEVDPTAYRVGMADWLADVDEPEAHHPLVSVDDGYEVRA